MKNKVLGLIFALLGGAIIAKDDTAQLTVALAQTGVQLYAANEKQQQSCPSAKNVRKELFWLFANNPLFYKLHIYQKNLDYYIALLTDHVAALEAKMLVKQSPLKSNAMRSGAILSAISALCGCGVYYTLYGRDILQNDPSASVGKAYHLSKEYMGEAVSFGLFGALSAVAAGNSFYKASRTAERIVERLERDKKLLAVLQEEKAAKDSNDSKNAADVAVNQLINTVTSAINTIAQSLLPVSVSAPVVPAYDAQDVIAS